MDETAREFNGIFGIISNNNSFGLFIIYFLFFIQEI